MKVLLVQPRGLVDVIQSLPAITALKQNRPQWTVHVLVPEAAVPVVENDPMIDAIYTLDDSGELRLRRLLAAEDYDIAVMLDYDRPLAELVRRAGVRRRIGFLNHWTTMLTLNRWVWPRMRGRHRSEGLLDLVQKLVGQPPEYGPPRIHLNAGQRGLGRDFRENDGDGAGRIVFIHPGDGRVGFGWEPECYALLANLLAERKEWRIFLIGGRLEREMMGELVGRLHSHVRVLQESHELREWLGLLTGGDLMIGSDGGPLHIASALGMATLGLFPPLPGCAPELCGPRGSTAHSVVPGLRCPARGKCFGTRCRHWNCFRKLAIENVFAVAGEILDEPCGTRSADTG